jgi:hypothetical protein
LHTQTQKCKRRNKRLAEAKTPDDKKIFQQQIDVVDKQINKLVYGLYRLQEEEMVVFP